MNNYSCKHCGTAVQSNRTPSVNGCPSGRNHDWSTLGEVGVDTYQCPRCGIVVKSNRTPFVNGCSSGSNHDWSRIAKGEKEKQTEKSETQNNQSNNNSNGPNLIVEGVKGSVEIVKGTFWLINKLKWIIIGAFVILLLWILVIRIKNSGANDALTKRMQAEADSLVALGNKNHESNPESKTEEGGKPNQVVPPSSSLNKIDVISEWTGDFGKDKLTINIQSIDDKGEVVAYDEVKGNKRTLKGNCEQTESGFNFKLSEPGDDKWDGFFTFEFDKTSNVLKGEWKANNGKSTKGFVLTKN